MLKCGSYRKISTGGKLMSRINRAMLTKTEIFIVATKFFFAQGYSDTSVRMIAQKLDMSNGNITFYYPTKEDILAEVIELLCAFQWQMMEKAADEGNSSIMAICLELLATASICEENEAMKDIYISAYTSPKVLEIIRRNDAKRAKTIFAATCSDWSDEQFAEAATLVSGIEYATLMKTNDSASLELRFSGALEQILSIFGVPEETRKMKIAKVLKLDYRAIGQDVLKGFIEFVNNSNTQTINELVHLGINM